MGTVLVAAGASSADLTVAAGEEVTLALVRTTAAGVPDDGYASVFWKGAGGTYAEQLFALDEKTIARVLAAPGEYTVTKSPGAFTVERS